MRPQLCDLSATQELEPLDPCPKFFSTRSCAKSLRNVIVAVVGKVINFFDEIVTLLPVKYSEYPLAPSPLGASQKELHLTRFPPGNPRAKGSFAQSEV
jgi:hypothetical protein